MDLGLDIIIPFQTFSFFSPQRHNHNAHVISCFWLVQRLGEHLNTWKQKYEIWNFVQANTLEPNHYWFPPLRVFPFTCNNSLDVAVEPH